MQMVSPTPHSMLVGGGAPAGAPTHGDLELLFAPLGA